MVFFNDAGAMTSESACKTESYSASLQNC